jgi:hypothetical protein
VSFQRLSQNSGVKSEGSPHGQAVEKPGVGGTNPDLRGGHINEEGVVCTYCGNPARLTSGAEIYRHRPDLHHLMFWHCYPCDAYVGCHKNSDAVPLGRLANKTLRAWKQSAHAAFDPLWKNGEMKRKDAYAWLAEELGIDVEECHIGMFDEALCERVVQVVKSRMSGRRRNA